MKETLKAVAISSVALAVSGCSADSSNVPAAFQIQKMYSAGYGVQSDKKPLHVLYEFTGGNDGGQPAAGLTAGTGGVFSGTTFQGGVHGDGRVFKIAPSASEYAESVLYSFTAQSDGKSPECVLIPKAGSLFGIANGGASGYGVVFKIAPAGSAYSETVLYNFLGGAGGAYPSGLTAAKAGSFYGTAGLGGANDDGVVFKLTPRGSRYAETVLYSFAGGSDGAVPSGGVVSDKSGNLYGTTGSGGASNSGTVYELSPSGSGYRETILHTFEGSDGAQPVGTLLLAKDGALYGTASSGGTGRECQHGCGTVFALMPHGSAYSFTTLLNFAGQDGYQPYSQLVANSAGVVYGTTVLGGASLRHIFLGEGAVFSLTPGPRSHYRQSILYSFKGKSDGGNPIRGPLLLINGALYGTASTSQLGKGAGTVFALSGI